MGDPIRDAALRTMLTQRQQQGEQFGFDPQGAPAGTEPGGTPLAGVGQMAYSMVPDPVIAAGRSLMPGGGTYQQEMGTLNDYKQGLQPSQVVDPAWVKNHPFGLQEDNHQQWDKKIEDTSNMVASMAGGGEGGGSWRVPGKTLVDDLGPGFLNQMTGELHGPFPFHDLSQVPESQWPHLEGDGGAVLRGEGPGLPRYLTREEWNRGDLNGGVHAPYSDPLFKSLKGQDSIHQGFVPGEENYLKADNQPMGPSRVIGSIDPMFAKHLPADAAQQPKYFSRISSPEMPTSGLPDEPSKPFGSNWREPLGSAPGERGHPSVPDQSFAQSDAWKNIEKNLSDMNAQRNDPAWNDPKAWWNRPIGQSRVGEPSPESQNHEFQQWLLNFLKDSGPAAGSNWPPPLPGPKKGA